MTTSNADSWAPPACTLPTTEQPLRVAEFDALFTDHVSAVRREGPTRVVLTLTGEPRVAGTAADLAARETDCCSFFSFDLRIANGAMTLAVEAGPAHTEVLGALADRAESLAGAAA